MTLKQKACLIDLKIASVDDGRYMGFQGKYPVIFFSFKDVKANSFDGALAAIYELVDDLYGEHRYLLDSNKIDDDEKAEIRECFLKFKGLDIGGKLSEQKEKIAKYSESLLQLSGLLSRHYEKNVYILIDEYDTPLNAAYQYGYLEELSLFMQDMFSAALKDNSSLEKGIMTGILRASRNSMLSGLNNLSCFTVLDKQYSEYFGFTDEEMVEIFQRQGLEASIEHVRNWYSGYKIGKTIIYNPWSIINCLSNKGKFKAYWIYSGDDYLIRQALSGSNDKTKKLFKEMLCASIDKADNETREEGEDNEENQIEVNITTNITYEDLMQSSSDNLWTLLVFGGYLTVGKIVEEWLHYRCELKIPNAEVELLYQEIFVKWLEEKLGSNKYRSLIQNLVQGNVEKFIEELGSYLLTTMSSHDFQSEAEYHTFVLGLICSVKDTHYVYSNKEYGLGRPDCLLIPRNRDQELGIILEFKLQDFKQHTDREEITSRIRVAAEQGLEQIQMRGYEYAFAQHPHVTRILQVGIAFSARCVMSAHRHLNLTTNESGEISYSEIHFSQDTNEDDEDENSEPVKKRLKVDDDDKTDAKGKKLIESEAQKQSNEMQDSNKRKQREEKSEDALALESKQGRERKRIKRIPSFNSEEDESSDSNKEEKYAGTFFQSKEEFDNKDDQDVVDLRKRKGVPE